MILASSILHNQKHKYSKYLNIVIFVGTCILPFDVINMNIINLFTDSSFLFLRTLNLYYYLGLIVFYPL